MHEKITLPNGVRLVYESIPYVRSVSLSIWIGTGSRFEKASENGSSHFIEHMVFKGTNSRSASDLANLMDGIGGQINAFTTKECTCFYGKVLDTHLGLLTDILCDMLFNPLFNENDVESERSVILEEIDMYSDTPEDLVSERLSDAVYKGTSLARPVLGSKKTLSRLTGESLRQYMRRHYTPDSVVVAVSGSISDVDVQNLKSRFSILVPGGKREIRSADYRPAFTVKRKTIEQNHLCLGFPGHKDGDPRRFAFNLMSGILGGGVSSRLFQNIREKRGLCYSIYSFNSSYADTGIFSVYTALGPDMESEALSLVIQEIKRFKDNGVTEEELCRVREQTKSNILLSLESTSNRASRLGRSELLLGDVQDIDRIIERYDSVTTGEILKLSDDFLDFNMISFSAVGKIRPADEYRELFARLISL